MMTNHPESTRTTSLKELKNDEAGSSPSRQPGRRTPRPAIVSWPTVCCALERYDPDAFERLASATGASLSPLNRIVYVTLHWPDGFGGPFSQSLIRKLARERNERLTGDALTTLTGAQRRNRLAALKAFIEAANWIGRDGLPSFEGDYLKVKSELSERRIRWPASGAEESERMHFYESFARSAGFADMLKASKARAEKPDAEPLRPALAHFIESDRPDAWRLYSLLRRIGLTIHTAAHEHRVAQDEDDEAPCGWPGDTWIERAYATLRMILEDLDDGGLQRMRVCRNPRCRRYFYALKKHQLSCSTKCTNRRNHKRSS